MRTSRAWPRALGIAAIALCGLLAGYLSYRGAHPRALIAALPAGTSAGAPGADQESSSALATHGKVPETIPNIQLPDLSGHARSLRSFLGHPLIVNFWATWCEPCRRELPLLARLHAQHQAEGLEIVGIAVDFPNAVQQYLQTHPVPYPLLAGETEGLSAITAFGMEPVLPFSIFADARGDILAVKVGELHSDDAQVILQALQEVAEGHETLPQARAAIAERLRVLAITRAKAAI